MTDLFFKNLFLGNFLDVKYEEMNVLQRGWVENPHDIMYFSGTVNAAYSVWGKVLVEMQLLGNVFNSSLSITGDKQQSAVPASTN